MQMDEGLDTGPIYCTAKLKDIDQLTIIEIEDALAQLGFNKLMDTLTEFELHHLDGKAKSQKKQTKQEHTLVLLPNRLRQLLKQKV